MSGVISFESVFKAVKYKCCSGLFLHLIDFHNFFVVAKYCPAKRQLNRNTLVDVQIIHT